MDSLNGTRIDSSGGKQICTYKGTLTTTTNWRTLPTQNKYNKLLMTIDDLNNNLTNLLQDYIFV